jgi:cell division protein FtsB
LREEAAPPGISARAADPAALRRRRWLLALGGLLCVLFCLHQLLGENGYLTLRARQREARQLENEVRRLTEEKQRMNREVDRLRNDPAAIERVAREEMKLVRPGEIIYYYTLPAAPSPPASAQARKK